MVKYGVFIGILVIFSLNLSKGQKVSLICPLETELNGKSWYAETLNNMFVDKANPPILELTRESTKRGTDFKPSNFSICVICTFEKIFHYPYEVEICIGHENMRKTNLVWARRGPLIWQNNPNTVGIEADLSKNEDLLSTLKNVQPITNPKRQISRLNCPKGFHLERFEMRSPVTKNGYLRRCIVCSGNQLEFSICASWDYGYYQSFLLPQLQVPDPDCPFNKKSYQEVCLLKISQITKGNSIPCGVYLDSKSFLYKKDGIKKDDLDFDCIFNTSISSNSTCTGSAEVEKVHEDCDQNCTALYDSQGSDAQNIGLWIFSSILMIVIIFLSFLQLKSKSRASEQQDIINSLQNHVNQWRNDENPYYGEVQL